VQADEGKIREKDKRTALNFILKKHLENSPMRGLENRIEACEIDPLLILAIGYQESRLGNAYAKWFNDKYHNPFGLMAGNSLIQFGTWEEAIDAECRLLTRLIKERRASTISLLGASYAADNQWPTKVESFYNQLWKELEGFQTCAF